MDLKEVELLGAGVGKHWYYRAKAAALTRLLSGKGARRVLDVGAGSAFFSRHLVECGMADEVCCVDISYPEDRSEVFLGRQMQFTRSVGALYFDVALFMDVLEHVDDDVALLREYVKKAPSGARFVVSVPAFRSLWSPHDVFLGHKRRYRLSEIEGVCRSAGLTVRSGCYYFGSVFPVAALRRLLFRFRATEEKPMSDLRAHGVLINSALHGLCISELPFMRLNRAFGLTAFCFAEKA